MKKKILLMTVLVVGVLIVVAIIAFFAIHAQSGTPGASTSTDGGVSQLASGTPVGLVIPSGDTIQIGTLSGVVTVKNFYKNVVAAEDEFLVLDKTADYEITYDTSRSSFYIEFFVPSGQESDVATARNDGEAALISMLGIRNSDACKLNVHEGLSNDSVAAADQPGMSFCSGSIPLSQ